VWYPCLVMSSGVETSLIFSEDAIITSAKNSQRFLDFARNDKNAQHFR